MDLFQTTNNNSNTLSVSSVPNFPMSGPEVLKRFGRMFPNYQKQELKKVKQVYFLGRTDQAISSDVSSVVGGVSPTQKGSRRSSASSKVGPDSKGGFPVLNIGDQVIYRFEIKEILGAGSFGKVFLAYDHQELRKVALKILKNAHEVKKIGKTEIRVLE